MAGKKRKKKKQDAASRKKREQKRARRKAEAKNRPASPPRMKPVGDAWRDPFWNPPPDLVDLIEETALLDLPSIDPIDWDRATRGGHTLDIVGDADLSDPEALGTVLGALRDYTERDGYLLWDTIIRTEQGLPLDDVHEEMLEIVPDDGPLVTVEGLQRPAEPWYESLRRVGPHVLGRIYRTDETEPWRYLDLLSLWLDVLDEAVVADALCLPEGARNVWDVLPRPLGDRQRVLGALRLLEGAAAGTGEGDRPSLAGEPGQQLLTHVLEQLDSHRASVAQLGLTLRSLPDLVILPEEERRVFDTFLRERLWLRSDADPIAMRLPPVPDELRVAPLEGTDDELVDRLLHCGLDVPPGLPRAVVERGEPMVARLCDILRDEDLWATVEEDVRSWALAHAFHLLGAIGSPSAVPALVDHVRHGRDWAITEDSLVGVLIRHGPAAIDPLSELMREPAGDDLLILLPVAEALVGIGLFFPAERARIGRIFGEKIEGEEDGEALSWLSSITATVDDSVVVDVLEALARRGDMDGVVDTDDIEKARRKHRPWEAGTSFSQPIEYFSKESMRTLKDFENPY